jgi:hypothetical protein
MKRLLIALVLAATVYPASGGAGKVRYPFVSPLQIIDATYFQRHNAGEIEVFVLSQASGGLLTFYLNGQPVAKLSGGEAIRLYLSPGRCRFGVIPSSHVVLSSLWEMNADVARNAPRFYRIFPSGGRNSGWGAAFEIAPLKNAEAQ